MTTQSTQKPKAKNLEEYTGEDRIVTSQQLRHELKRKPEPPAIRFQPKFFPSVISAVEGFSQGELIIISGPTKSGKTLLAQSLTYAFAQNDVDCVWFSYEVPAPQFIRSFPDNMLPKFFLPREIHAQNIDWFEQRTIEALQKFAAKVIFVDHLHFLFDMAKVRNVSLDIGSYVRRIKRFAVLHGLVVFLMTHITKVDPTEEISYAKIRDSSFIPQESDSVFLIRRLADKDGEVTNEAELKIEFHRRTGVMKKKIRLFKEGGYLWEKHAGRGPEQEKTLPF